MSSIPGNVVGGPVSGPGAGTSVASGLVASGPAEQDAGVRMALRPKR